jgi:putative ABC transport system substrate-binding protein
MRGSIKHLLLPVGLILLTIAVLLHSDRQQRTAGPQAAAATPVYPAIAILQITSTSLLDDHVAGVLARLGELGLVAPADANIRRYNPQGDYATAGAMARDIAAGPADLVITSSTLALQLFAKANEATRKRHVFGAVTDPLGTGVGITGPAADQHPPHMAGIGTFQPVRSAIRLAKTMAPRLQRLGVVWNPAEQCSAACLAQARATCAELGIELLEVNAGNTSEVPEATRALLTRQPNALWVGGDTVATAALHLILHLASEAGVPVFTNDPADAARGALFGLGADYVTVGRYTADLAAAILAGRSPASFATEAVIPEQLRINPTVLARQQPPWVLPDSQQHPYQLVTDNPTGQSR